MATLINADTVFKSVAGWYVGVAAKTLNFAAVVGGAPTYVQGADAGGAYTAAEQDLINEIKATVNSNNAFITALQNAISQDNGSITELQRALEALAKITGAAVAARNQTQFRGPAPAQNAPGSLDFPTFLAETATSSRVNVGETAITTANVGTLELQWQTPIGAGVLHIPTVVDEVLYYADATGRCYAVRYDGAEVQKLWEYQADQLVLSSIVVTQNHCVIFDFSGSIHILDRASGVFQRKVRPQAHPAAAFFGGQGTVDPVRGWVYFTVPSIQETLIALSREGIFQGNGSLNGDSISAPIGGAQVITKASAPFTNDDLYREITIQGAGLPGNNIRYGFIINVISPTQILVLNPAGAAEVFPATATYQITTPFARYILDLANDPPSIPYPIAGSFVPSIHALDPVTGQIKWSTYTIDASNFTAGTPLVDTVNESLVVANLPGSTFGYPPGVPSVAGFNVYNPASKATDIFGNPRYDMGPSGGDPWGAMWYDPATDLLYVPTGEGQAPPLVDSFNAVLCLRASDGSKVWTTQLSSDATLPDIWDDGLGTRGPNIKTGNLSAISAPDADGYSTITDVGAFVATDALSGRVMDITGASNPTNNGHFAVAEFVDADNVKILNPDAVLEGAGAAYELFRAYDLDIGCTPMVVVSTGGAPTKYVVAAGKDGRVYVLNPTTGAIVSQKQMLHPGLVGGFQTGCASQGDICWLVGGNTQIGRESELLNVGLDITRMTAAQVIAVQITDAGSIVKLWQHSLDANPGEGITLTTGPFAGTELLGSPGFALCVANNVVYVQPPVAPILFGLNATTGAELLRLNIGSRSTSCPVVSRGKVYAPQGSYLPLNFRFPPELLQFTGNVKVFGLPT